MVEENKADIVAGSDPVGEVSPKPDAQPTPHSKPVANASQTMKGNAKVTADVRVKPRPAAAKFSEEDKAEKLKRIERLVLDGKSTIKQAAQKVGIAEQTYYNWKKAAGRGVDVQGSAEPEGDVKAENTGATELNASPNVRHQADDLADLVQLEAENTRLRKMLAERLRAENVELRKRLGLV
ncbi:transposase [Ensifer sp. Root127]|uniref:transposase n=1 Tax=Ensifer sp. Root127 TaxID=1736440 RepID=UPI00070C341B|nr:transposase [Ensifer sp. Root127]KQW72397.1 hypothetical protein ASD03_32085 [Ensifer sp. Root127]